jgi:hypothetical protein
VTDALKGEYKLLRQVHGKGTFGWVTLTVEQETSSGPAVGVADSVDSPTEWIDAAMKSCARCLEILRAHGAANESHRVVVTNVIGTHVDTTADAVEAAAALAMAHAFGLLDEFHLQHDGRWHVDWSPKRLRVI